MDGTSGSYTPSVYKKKMTQVLSDSSERLPGLKTITYHLLYSLKAVLHLNTFVTYSVGYCQRLQLKLLALLGCGTQSCSVILSLSLDSPVLFPSVREGSWESLHQRDRSVFVFSSTLSPFKLFCMCMLQFYFDLLKAAVCSFSCLYVFLPFSNLSHVTKP